MDKLTPKEYDDIISIISEGKAKAVLEQEDILSKFIFKLIKS